MKILRLYPCQLRRWWQARPYWESEGLLRDRLKSWPRYIGDALKFTAPKSQQFKGRTPPWEAQGSVEYTVPYGRGLLFALRVENLPTLEETKKALRHLEKQLQDRYDPALGNDTVAGRKLRDKWVRNHGWPVVTKKSEAVMTTIKTRICVAPDGTLTGRASGLPPGEHEAEIALLETVRGAARPDADALLARVRAIQEEMAQLPVLDRRNPDEIIGYNQRGHFD